MGQTDGIRTGRSAARSELLMAAVVIARSTSFVISKMTVASMGPFDILAVRFLTASLLLLLLFHRKLRRCTARTFRNGILLGIVYTLVMGFEMLGLRSTESSFASLIENSAFLLVPVLELVFLHVRPRKRVVAGMLLSFAGLLTLEIRAGTGSGAGAVLLLFAMTFYSVAIFLTSIFAQEGDPLLTGIVQVGTMGVLSLLCTLLFEDPRLPATAAEWEMIAILAVVCSVFGFTLQPVAQRGLPADRAGMFTALSPLAAMVWGRLILGEPISAVKAVGAALILSGILLPISSRKGDRGTTDRI